MGSPSSAVAATEAVDTVPFDRLCGAPMELGQFLRIAARAAKALADLHRTGTVHRNVRPQTLSLDPRTGEVTLARTGESVGLLPNQPVPGVLVEALPYMAPEQTGRMNRSVDHRADLYSLGISFYELLTGTLPFHGSDTLEWVHCHVARLPRPPSEVAKGVPQVVSDILLRLLAKVAEDRYQSARGLQTDLEKCLAGLDGSGGIAPFPLGERDISDRLQLPQKLYGRDEESAALHGAYERVAQGGVPEVMLISGSSGIGKSALVHELHKPVARENAFFITGKFDQHKRNVPYSTLVQAFRDLAQQLLAQSEERLGAFRRNLEQALGASGQVIIDVIPHMELVLGKQPPVEMLPLNEAQNRFNRVFQQFIGVFAKKEHTLVLFLDDLQWVDLASLRLLQHIVTHPDTRHLFLVGAYRDNEVAPDHSLMATVGELQKAGVPVGNIGLSPFSIGQLNQLLADTLRCAPAATTELAELVHGKTGGNPFFATQFLGALRHEGLLYFNEESAAWRWSIEQIHAKGFTDNVVDLMVQRLRQFPAQNQNAIVLAACLGNQFDLRTLAVLNETSEDETRVALHEPLREGLVVNVAERYRFLHDRVQQAAYSLISEDQRGEIHLRIGRLLLSRATELELDNKIFDIVNHVNAGLLFLANDDERAVVAALNLKAGSKAKTTTAYDAARTYFAIGMSLLPAENAWKDHYALTLALHRELAECEYLSGAHEAAEKLFEDILANAQSSLDKAEVYEARVAFYTTSGHYEKGVRVGQEALRLLGAGLPETREEWAAAADAELRQMRERLEKVDIEGLVDAPLMTDPQQKTLASLLTHISSSAFNVDHNLLKLLNLRIVGLSLDHGHADTSAVGYAWYGTILATHLQDFAWAARLGKLAIRLIEKLNSSRFKSKVYDLVGWYVDFWSNPIDASYSYCWEGYRAGLEHGDLLYAGFNLMGCDLWLTARASRLDTLEKELREHILLQTRIRHEMAIQHGTVLLQSVQSLKGLSHGPGDLSDAGFDEPAFIARSITGKIDYAASSYYVVKMQLLEIFEDHAGAMAMAAAYQPVKDSSIGCIVGTEYRLFHSLALAASHGSASPEDRAANALALAAHHETFERLSRSCPQNFLDKYLLVSAEQARVTGGDMEAIMKLYDRAIAAARDNGFARNECLGNELAARFYLERGFTSIAAVYLHEARAGYVRWGANGKVHQLDERYPELLRLSRPAAASPGGVERARIEKLDVMTVIKASQAISSEIVRDKLIATLMHIVLESAGARRGSLLLLKGDELAIAAEVKIEGDGVVVSGRRERSEPVATGLPTSIVNYVRRTGESVIYGHGEHRSLFEADPYYAHGKQKSAVCVPILRQAELSGMLYLENDLVADAFTPERLSVLELLASQAAISLENAGLYSELSQENAERRRAEEEVRTLNSELELRVQDRTAQLQAANKELEAFSYSVSHDLRTPLRTIDGFGIALLEDFGDTMDAEARDYLGRILRATKRMAELIEDMLNLSRVTRAEMKREAVDLSRLAQDLLDGMRQAEPGRKVECVVEAGLRASGDGQLLKIVLENLIGNAWKFTSKKERAHIEIGAAQQPDGRTAYFVRDDGAGFDMNFVSKLFGAFQRMHSVEEFPGTGIGLATVQRIITRHGGQIWTQSAVDQGTTFYFTL